MKFDWSALITVGLIFVLGLSLSSALILYGDHRELTVEIEAQALYLKYKTEEIRRLEVLCRKAEI